MKRVVILGVIADPETKTFTSDDEIPVELLLSGNETANEQELLELIVVMDSIIREGSTVEVTP